MEPILVIITAGSKTEAKAIANTLLESRLVACVNRMAGVRSDFWWQGERDKADEVLILAKTRRDLWPQVMEAIRAAHSYDVFEALAIPIVEGNPDYLRWIEESTAPAAPAAEAASNPSLDVAVSA